jgi:hypothetical protein
MDSLNNYQNLISSIAASNQALSSAVAEKKQEVQDKIKEFTQPFEMTAADNLIELLGHQVQKVANKYNVPIEKAKKYIEAYKKGGARGMIEEAKQDFKNKLSKQGEVVPERIRLGDMPKEDFAKIRNVSLNAIDANIKQLSPEDKEQFQQKLAGRVVDAEQEPDKILRFQQNQQHALDVLDEIKNSNLVSQITRTPGDVTDEFGQGLKSTTTVFKNSVSNAESLAGKAEGAAQDTLKGLKDIKKVSKIKSLTEDIAKGAVEGEEGDPEGGAVVGAVVGLGTFLGGLFAARHKAHHISAGPIMNFAIQQGA